MDAMHLYSFILLAVAAIVGEVKSADRRLSNGNVLSKVKATDRKPIITFHSLQFNRPLSHAQAAAGDRRKQKPFQHAHSRIGPSSTLLTNYPTRKSNRTSSGNKKNKKDPPGIVSATAINKGTEIDSTKGEKLNYTVDISVNGRIIPAILSPHVKKYLSAIEFNTKGDIPIEIRTGRQARPSSSSASASVSISISHGGGLEKERRAERGLHWNSELHKDVYGLLPSADHVYREYNGGSHSGGSLDKHATTSAKSSMQQTIRTQVEGQRQDGNTDDSNRVRGSDVSNVSVKYDNNVKGEPMINHKGKTFTSHNDDGLVREGATVDESFIKHFVYVRNRRDVVSTTSTDKPELVQNGRVKNSKINGITTANTAHKLDVKNDLVSTTPKQSLEKLQSTFISSTRPPITDNKPERSNNDNIVQTYFPNIDIDSGLLHSPSTRKPVLIIDPVNMATSPVNPEKPKVAQGKYDISDQKEKNSGLESTTTTLSSIAQPETTDEVKSSTVQTQAEPKPEAEPESEPEPEPEPEPEAETETASAPDLTNPLAEPGYGEISTPEPMVEQMNETHDSTTSATPEHEPTGEPSVGKVKKQPAEQPTKQTTEREAKGEPSVEPKNEPTPGTVVNEPEEEPTGEPEPEPTTAGPHREPTSEPTVEPEVEMTKEPSGKPKEEPKGESNSEPKNEPNGEPEDEPNGEPKNEPNGEPKNEPNGEPKNEPNGEPKSEPEDEPKGEPEDEPKNEPNGEPKSEPEDEPKGEPEDEPKGEPEDEPNNEPNGDGSTEPESEPEGENGIAEPSSEPGPDWEKAKKQWRFAWEIHIYGFGGLFAAVGLYTLLSLLRLWRIQRLLSKPYFFSLNLLILFMCASRSFYMLYDSYNAEGSFPISLDYFLYSIPFPCLTSAFSILLYALLKATHMQLVSQAVQRMPVMAFIVIFHFIISIVTDVLLGLYANMQVLLFVCQMYFIVWGLFLFFGYAHIFRKIYTHAVKRQKNLNYQNAAGDASLTNSTSKKYNSSSSRNKSKGRFTLSTAVKVTFFTAICGLMTVGLEIYAIVGVYKTFTLGTPEPWPWWLYHTVLRLVEFLMCMTMSYVASQPFRYKASSSSSLENHKCSCGVLCIPCGEIFCCGQKSSREENSMTGWSDVEFQNRYTSKLQSFNNGTHGSFNTGSTRRLFRDDNNTDRYRHNIHHSPGGRSLQISPPTSVINIEKDEVSFSPANQRKLPNSKSDYLDSKDNSDIHNMNTFRIRDGLVNTGYIINREDQQTDFKLKSSSKSSLNSNDFFRGQSSLSLANSMNNEIEKAFESFRVDSSLDSDCNDDSDYDRDAVSRSFDLTLASSLPEMRETDLLSVDSIPAAVEEEIEDGEESKLQNSEAEQSNNDSKLNGLHHGGETETHSQNNSTVKNLVRRTRSSELDNYDCRLLDSSEQKSITRSLSHNEDGRPRKTSSPAKQLSHSDFAQNYKNINIDNDIHVNSRNSEDTHLINNAHAFSHTTGAKELKDEEDNDIDV